MSENPWLREGCVQFTCPKYPKCCLAAGGCCDITNTEDMRLVTPEDCFLRPDKPRFTEKPDNSRYLRNPAGQ